jgi:4-hydroxy-3-polyprenylbenzoate decarboxylase
MGMETHLVLTPAALETIALETDYKVGYVESLATISYRHIDLSAAISSGSFQTDGMGCGAL